MLNILKHALTEDIGSGDVTTLATIPDSQILYGEFLAKDDGVLAGLEVVKKIYKLLNKKIVFKILIPDGTKIKKGDIVASVEGHGRSIMIGERTVLNFLQRMSSIATTTAKYVDAVKDTNAIILDTRKTVPGLRFYDKLAVKIGGGQNHRFGLFDMYLIKDNHIVSAGSITKAFKLVQESNKNNLLIEIEVKNLKELSEALSLKPDRIMLDNMNLDEMKKAVNLVNGLVPLEASGGVNFNTVSKIAKTGVDYISIGALTHSVIALDISFNIIDKF